MGKKGCRCRLFSCFACFSDENTTPSGAQPDPSEIAPVDPSYVTSTTAPSATDDSLTHHHHGPQPIVPPAVSTSSEAITSTDVLIELNDPQPVVHPDLSSSSQPNTSPVAFPAHDKVYEVGSSSSNTAANNPNVPDDQPQGTPSSSSVSKASDLTCRFTDGNTTPSGAQPDPSEIVPVDSSHVTSAPNATDDALTHPHHGPQPIAPPAASTSSEAITSTDVLIELNGPQPIVNPDLSSSFQPNTSPVAFPAHDKVYEAGSSSTNAAANNPNVPDDQLQGTPSSSSVSQVSDLINNILTAAKEVDRENVDADLDGLIGHISRHLELIKEQKKTGKKSSKTKSAVDYWQSRAGSIRKWKDILSEGISVFKDFFTQEVKTVIQGLLKGMGMAHLATTGLLVVALVLERYDTMSSNKDECLCVLDEICKLAQHINDFKQRPGLREAMEASIKEATDLIVEASIMCYTQIGSATGWRFLSAAKDQKELVKFQQELQRMYRHMDSKMGLCLYDSNNCRHVRPQKPRERPYPDYAVGIEEPLEEVKELLEWESEKNAVAVILHGFGGMGKTTLADAVFARLYIEGCKYSMVRLFDDVTSSPSTSDIIKLQKYILEDLKMGTLEETHEKIRTPEDGQREIGRILEKEKAFIYVDNVLQRYPFEQLLPKDMDKAKKLRLLITTRDTDVSKECRKLKTKIYPMKGLPHIEAKSLLEKEMYNETDNKGKQLSSGQLDHIVEMCGYIPKLLTVVAGFISCAEDQQKAYSRLKEEREKNWKGEIGDDIAHYVFAYQNLDERLKDPFLDICSFFNGWEWSEVADIVGDGELNRLEKRALVTKRPKTKRVYYPVTRRLREVVRETVWVHDVILAMGHQQAEGTRFTSAKQIQDFLDWNEDKDIRKIKGIVLISDGILSASKLDLMSRSLRVFRLEGKVEGKCEKIFEKLLCFKGKIGDLPFDVSRSKELKYLELTDYLKEAEDLNQELTLSKCKYTEELLGSVSKVQDLRVFKLYGCKNLKHLPKDFGSLNSLRKLHLCKCKSLETLPSSLGNLSSLQELDLSGCESLKDVPHDLGKLSSLVRLNLSGCKELSSIPSSFGNLSSLQELDLSECESLKDVPHDLGKLSSLVRLDLSGCKELSSIPSSFGNLSSLQELNLSTCKSLKDLPHDLGKLSSLVRLFLSGCKELSSIPSSFGNLSSLRLLHLSRCENLKDLPSDLGKLTSLGKLHLQGCKELSSIPESIGNLKSLESSINLSITGLKELPDGFCNLSFITDLEMKYCDCLEKLPGRFGEVTSLRKLSLGHCKRLKKLPETFGQLKYLEELDLSQCTILEELCIDFHRLSSLRVLSMNSCITLKKLPEDFHCISSLEVLGLGDCHMLEGKWMESMVKMKTLQIVNIRGSQMLEERWDEIQRQGDHSWSFAVYTGQVSSNEESKEHIFKQLHSKIDSILTNGGVSDLPLNTLLLLMFDGEKNYYNSRFSLIEENIVDIQTNVVMIYFGNHFHELPKKMADRILGHAPDSNAQAFFRKVLAAFIDGQYWGGLRRRRFDMSAKIVKDEKGAKCLSCWEFLSSESVEKFVIKNCGRCLKLKQLVEEPRESNIELLRELFASGEEESTLRFLKNDASEVPVEELEGKTILLDIRSAKKCYDIPLQSLMEMYFAEKERLNFEIITVPIIQGAREYVFEEVSRQVPWLLLQNPGQLKSVVKFFLVEDSAEWLREWADQKVWDRWQPGIMRVIESKGTIAAYNPGVLRMVNTWGAKAYPFTEEKSKELEEEERKEMKAMSHLEFLFKHLESLRDQVKEGSFKGKMICLCSSSEASWACSIRNALIEFSDNIHMIYIPQFISKQPMGFTSFTDGIEGHNFWLEKSKMPEDEMQGMCVLNLSEHEAMRFWARIYSLKKCIEGMDDNDDDTQLDGIRKLLYPMDEDGELLTSGMDDNDEQLDGIKKLLNSIDHGDRYDQYSWMGIMDEDGELVTTLGKEFLENSEDKAKELIQQIFNCPKECRKETLQLY